MANEVRLIDANALEQFFLHESKRLRERLIELDDIDDKEEMDYILSFLPTVEWARKTVHSVSTIDPESLRPKGRWSYKWDAERDPKRLFLRIVCSECNLHTGQKSNYCPNCGAKMER